jgi:hypothetical protein
MFAPLIYSFVYNTRKYTIAYFLPNDDGSIQDTVSVIISSGIAATYVFTILSIVVTHFFRNIKYIVSSICRLFGYIFKYMCCCYIKTTHPLTLSRDFQDDHDNQGDIEMNTN